MKIVVSNQYDGPIYEQIKSQILQAILTGGLVPGDILPSLRSLAKELSVGVLTINRAYGELEGEGYIENRQGKGCFVAARSIELIKQHLIEESRQKMIRAIDEAREAGASDDDILMLFRQCLEENPIRERTGE